VLLKRFVLLYTCLLAQTLVPAANVFQKLVLLGLSFF